MTNELTSLGLRIPNVLLPNPRIDISKWAVVACDQYTSQPGYWEEVARLVGDQPSTLELIFPEVYLGKGEDQQRIERIHHKMKEYLENGVLTEQAPGFIYVERQTGHSGLRRGLIALVDLECYDYHPGSKTLIRATEGTVLERIPPRVQIRKGAPIELPHIMILIDDPDHQVIEPLAQEKNKLSKVYDVDLMMQGGHVTGYHVGDPEVVSQIVANLKKLAEPAHFQQKYCSGSNEVLLFAVGDGNHSLATAKAVWEELKKASPDKNEIMNHPARFALVELVNVHDQGLIFEPIHRVMFGVQSVQFWAEMEKYYNSIGSVLSVERFQNQAEMRRKSDSLRADRLLSNCGKDVHLIEFVTADEYGLISVGKPKHNLEVGTLQSFLDEYLQTHSGTEVDYIHGSDVVSELGKKPGNIGFFLPAMDKRDLFKTVIVDGVLPRKTFSMGEAEEKRYYIECRKIV